MGFQGLGIVCLLDQKLGPDGQGSQTQGLQANCAVVGCTNRGDFSGPIKNSSGLHVVECEGIFSGARKSLIGKQTSPSPNFSFCMWL